MTVNTETSVRKKDCAAGMRLLPFVHYTMLTESAEQKVMYSSKAEREEHQRGN